MTTPINYEAWARGMISFIRHKRLELEFQDYCGGWPCPVAASAPPTASGRLPGAIPETTDYANGWNACRQEARRLLDASAPHASGWRPIAEAPLNTLVVLLDMRRRMSDDILGHRKDIGYLTEGRWWATHGETRAITEDSYTHFMPLPPPPASEPSE